MSLKNILLLGLLFCLTDSLRAQTWNDLNLQAKELYSKREYEKAIPIAIKALAAAEAQYGKINQSDPFYAIGLENLGYLYFSTKDYLGAIPYFEEVIEIWDRVFAFSPKGYFKNTDILAYLYFEVKDYEKAERLQIETNDGMKVLYGDTSLKYIQNVNDLVLLYKETDQYDKLITARAELMELYRMKFGEYSIEYLGEMIKLARHYVKGEDFSNAEPLLLRGLELGKKILGEDNKDYAIDLNYVAIQYYKQGEYSKAETLYLQSLEVTKSGLGEYDPSYTATLGNLALVYVNTGQYEKAEPLFVLAIRNYKKFDEKEKEDLNYTALLGNLASLYERMGQTQKAEPLYLEALQIRKSMNLEDEDYANCLFNLAGLYKNLGLNEKAEIMYRQSLEVMITLLGDKSAAYGKAINTVALFYKTMGRYNESKTLFYTSLEILKASIGDQHIDYATALHNFAMLYTDLKEYDQAESYYLQAGAIWKNTLGENHPFYTQLENNLSLLYLAQRDYKKAESLLLKNVEKRKKILGELHPDYAVSLNNLAVLYWNLGDYKKAELYLTQSGEIDKQYLLNVASVLSENEKNQFLVNNVTLNEERNSFLYYYPMSSRAFYKENYNLQLLLKSFSLSAGQRVLTELRQTQDTAVQRIFLQWQDIKKQLATQYSLSEEDRTEDVERLQNQTENLEKQLNRQSASFRKLSAAFQLSITEVQRNLDADEVAIEFVSFALFNKTWTDSTIYGAYILKKNDSVPVFVPLCEEKQLQQLFDSAGTTATDMVSKFYRGLEIKNKNTAGTLGTELYKLIWQPLEPYLKGIKKISYSPAGKLYSIAFHALPVDSTTLLMDKYQLQQYTSTRQVALRNSENKTVNPTGIALFGDANFSMDSLQITKQRINQPNTEISTSIYTPSTRGANNNSWPNLPGTAEEVKKINALFNQNRLSTKTFTQTTASEENLKTLSGNSPQILHIATHGFFLPGPDKKKSETGFSQGNTYTLADDPLLRSGLILSGGNYAWSGKTPIDGVEDGIATAYEISQLNLSNTELVVLSACETALGDVKGSEGVFGLQRAFKMAGVKKMIVSLWQVPDKETAELMTTFYTYWMKGKTINESFTQAQADMRKKYSPFYWAAFVLVE